MNITDIAWLTSSYFGTVIGAILFFLLSYLLADYIVDFLKWIEEGLIKIPLVDLLFGAIGLILGLFVAYLINIPIRDMSLKIVSEIIPLFFTIVLGYLGFQVGCRRREEFMNILMISRKERNRRDTQTPETGEIESQNGYNLKSKILDT